MEITAKDFLDATGREPIQDDLERVNCPDAGKPGHECCGWDFKENKPAFESPRNLDRQLRNSEEEFLRWLRA